MILVPSKKDRARIAGSIQVDQAQAVARCQYCSARCGGGNKCGSTAQKQD